DRLMRPGCPRRVRDAVWRHLVLRSRVEGATWTVACVGVALPALASVASWLAERYPGDRGDIHAEVLTGFLTGLATVDLRPPGVFTRLRWIARRAGLTALHDALDAPAPVPSGYGSVPPPPPAGHPDLVLAKAVTDGVLSRLEADLIGATRLEEIRLTAWAGERRMGHQFASRLRARAETRLLAWLTGAPGPTDSKSPSVTDGGNTEAVAGWLAPASEGTVLAVWREPGGRVRWRACDSEPAARAVLARLGADPTPTPTTRPAAGTAAGTVPAEAEKSVKKVRAQVRETAPKTGLLQCGGSTPTAPPPAPPGAGQSSEAPRCA
ncbi:MAG TPA: hypothetical protein VMU51_00795, partial [Mycobacteriales bacterium]|nr:hypothetical protein [Mycobacteriales bacterium]